MSSTRIYWPLTDQTRYIRLLTMLPSKWGGHIRFVLKQYQYRSDGSATTEAGRTIPNRQEGLAYTALSYAWGSPSEVQHFIDVNGKNLPVRQNLWEVLQEVQKSDFCGYLWIDAICINQSDIAEKNTQVAMMGYIFALATSVLVWLGPAADDSDYFMEVVRVAIEQGSTLDSIEELSSAARFLQATEKIRQRSYWSRTWVIQELGLSTGVITLRCGSQEFSYRDESWLHSVFPFEKDSVFPPQKNSVFPPQKDSVFPPEKERQWDCFLTRKMWDYLVIRPLLSLPRGNKFQLDKLLFTYHHTKCSDPKDKVYALVSLAQDVQEAWDRGVDVLRPDYDKDVEELAWEVVDFKIAGILTSRRTHMLSRGDRESLLDLFKLVMNSPDEMRFEQEWHRRYGPLCGSSWLIDGNDLTDESDLEGDPVGTLVSTMEV
jgi:Heterokaryon incompatibility protein (HET)